MARPTEFKEEYIEKTLNYIKNYSDLGDIVPSVAGLAMHIGVSKQSLYTWSKIEGNEEFLDAFSCVRIAQEKQLINGGLGGEFNPAIAKMMMAGHGYSDKQEVDVSSTDGTMTPKPSNPISEDALNKIIDKL